MKENISKNLYEIMEIVEAHKQEEAFDLELIKPYLNEHIQIRVVPKDGYITKEDVLIRKVYYIVSGTYYTIRTSPEGKSNILAKRGAPQLIGVDRAVDPFVAGMSSNLALDTCIILEMDQEYFVKCVRENGDLALKVIKNICEKLVNASLRSDRLLFSNSSDHLMLYIYRYWTESHSGQLPCKIKVKHAYIADDIGITTRTLYRALNDLKSKDLISVKKGCITVTYEQIQHIKELCSHYNQERGHVDAER